MSLLLGYYGDDFTGSTDALEALAGNGVRTVLFLGIPSDEHLRRFSGYDAVGIAGESRSQNPQWMREHLPVIFRFLRSLAPEVTQYKVCSTFDSSPEVGNIGIAIRIGREIFGSQYVPVVVAAPHLGRYVLFGNLFAAQGDVVYRIDRHPTMSRHPVTPMDESDLRLHLGKQLNEPVELFDLLALSNYAELVPGKAGAIIFDGLNEQTELATGRILWERRRENPFLVGSAGLTYALMRHLAPSHFEAPRPAPVDRLIVASGSCSPVTEMQIRSALKDGFQGFSFDSPKLLTDALEALSRGKSIVVYSALGAQQISGGAGGDELGRGIGKLLRDLVARSGVRRVIIAGGDTASHATQQLGAHALTFLARLAPGAPLCRARSDDAALDGLELVLKGGQVGGADFFTQVKKGHG